MSFYSDSPPYDWDYDDSYGDEDFMTEDEVSEGNSMDFAMEVDYSYPIPTLYSYFMENDKLKTFLNGKFSDISVKIENRSFPLHRVVLSLKSEYFQKLFSSSFREYKQETVEIKDMEEKIFECVVKYLYNEELPSLITSDNMINLLVALDYLGVDVKLEAFESFIERNPNVEINHIFELYNFLQLQTSYPRLITAVLKYFSGNLLKVSATENFLNMTFDVFKSVLLTQTTPYYDERYITTICAKWISHDSDNRCKHVIDIVNAIKQRYSRLFYISNLNMDFKPVQCENKEKYFRKKLDELLKYSCQFSTEITSRGSVTSFVINTYTKRKKDVKEEMKRLRNDKDLSDVKIHVENEVFYLHRVVLATQSEYFQTLFTENDAEAEKEVHINDIDKLSFETVIDYLYYEKIDITDKHIITNVLRASDRFKLNTIFTECKNYILDNIESINDIFSLYSYLREQENSNLISTVEAHILENWHRIHEYKHFHNMPLNILQEIVSLSNLFVRVESDITRVCSKWICHDVKTRFKDVPALMKYICRCFAVNGIYDTNVKKVLEHANPEEYVEGVLRNTLRRNSVISIIEGNVESKKPNNRVRKPFYVAFVDSSLRFYKCNVSKKKLLCSEILDMKLSIPDSYRNVKNIGAVIVGDALFVKFEKERDQSNFYVQNLLNGKCMSLTSDVLKETHSDEYQLLNCNNNVYLCLRKTGKLLKYSFALNRWLTATPSSQKNMNCIFTSSGKMLYAISVNKMESYKVSVFNEDQKEWLPETEIANSYEIPMAACVVDNGNKLFVAFKTFAKLYDFRNKKWCEVYANVERQYHSFTHVQQVKDFIVFLGPSKLFTYNLISKTWPKEGASSDNLQNTNFHSACIIHTINK